MEAARGAAERFRDGGCGGFPSGIGGAGRSAAGGLGASAGPCSRTSLPHSTRADARSRCLETSGATGWPLAEPALRPKFFILVFFFQKNHV